MPSNDKTHWPTAHILYFMAGLLDALVGFGIRHHSLGATWVQLIGGSVTLFIGIAMGTVIVVLVAVMLRHKYRPLGWASRLTASLFSRLKLFASKKWYYFLAWFGAGLATFGFAQFVSGNTTSAAASMLAGPLAVLLSPYPALLALIVVAYSLSFAEGVRVTNIAKHKSGKWSVVAGYRNARKVMNKTADWAPACAPEAAHFAQVVSEASVCLIKPEDLPNRVSIGVAHLASDWGRPKHPVEVGAPTEGSVILIGASRAGKTVLGQRAMLSTEEEDHAKGVLATKWVNLSVKSLDIAGVVTPYFRSIGMPVQMWDLNTREPDPTCGDPVRWAPNMAVTTYDQAKEIGKRLAESARDPASRGEESPFWVEKCSQIIAICVFASVLRRLSFEKSVRLMLKWDDPLSLDVETLLEVAAETLSEAADALDDWRKLRSSVLDRTPEGKWVAKQTGSGADTTGQNISHTFSGLMQEIATQAVYDATADPSFDPRTFIRTAGSSAVFLIGNRHKEGMTRALLAPVIEAIIREALEYANEQPDERLPYRLVLFADELPNLAPIKNLQKVISTSGSARITVIVVAQSYAQLQQVYGHDTARILLDAAGAVVVLSGIVDPEFIRALNTIGGTKQVELDDKMTTPHALIEGQHLLALKRPNAKTGAPGTALMVMEGAVVEIERPLWTFEERFDDRGTVLAQFKKSTEELRATRRPKGRFQARARANGARCLAWVIADRWQPDPVSQATDAPGSTRASGGLAAPGPAPVARPLTPRPGDTRRGGPPAVN